MMNRRVWRILAFLPLAVALIGCNQRAAGSLPITRMRIGSKTFNLEIATREHDQEVGLMHRDHLDSDHGMIFIFDDVRNQSFWNHDVHFPLDVVFLNTDGVVISIKHMDAYSDRSIDSGGPVKYAVELNAGAAARLNLNLGDRLDLPKDALNPPGR